MAEEISQTTGAIHLLGSLIFHWSWVRPLVFNSSRNTTVVAEHHHMVKDTLCHIFDTFMVLRLFKFAV